MRRSWEAVVECTLKRTTASSPFEEKEREKIGTEIAAAGFEICRWEIEACAGEGRVGLGYEENELKERSLSWVLAGGLAGSGAVCICIRLDQAVLQLTAMAVGCSTGSRTLENIDTTIFTLTEFSWEAVYAGGVCHCTGTASTGTGPVSTVLIYRPYFRTDNDCSYSR